MRTLAVLALLVGVVVAALAVAQERAPSGSEPSVQASEGQRLFSIQGCYGCHTVGKFGSPIGPDLSHVATRLSRGALERWIRDPELQRPSAHMPKLELEDEEVTALAAYLSSLR